MGVNFLGISVLWFFGVCIVLALGWLLLTEAYERVSKTAFYERNEGKLPYVITLLATCGYVFLMPGTSTWSGEGSISIFPQNSAAKNYRLDSDNIEVSQKKRGWFHKEYSYVVTSAQWPNGGELEFSPKCKINYPNSSAVCNSNSGTYRVEVTDAPIAPDDGGSDESY